MTRHVWLCAVTRYHRVSSKYWCTVRRSAPGVVAAFRREPLATDELFDFASCSSIVRQRIRFRRRSRCWRMRAADAERDSSFVAVDVSAVRRSFSISAQGRVGEFVSALRAEKYQNFTVVGIASNDDALETRLASKRGGSPYGSFWIAVPSRPEAGERCPWSALFGHRPGRVFFGPTERCRSAVYLPAYPASLHGWASPSRPSARRTVQAVGLI